MDRCPWPPRPASLPLLSDGLFAVLVTELDEGPVANGWPDQTWLL